MERRELPRYPVIDAAATGRNLRRLRLEKGYSVKGLQDYLGVSMNEILVERESA